MSTLPIPFGNPYTYAGHSGVDFPQMRGTPFRASGPGVVSSIDYSPRAGHTVWVRYDSGPNVGYCHMDYRTSNVRVGQRVGEGTVLGLVGSLGLASTGPHLHVEVAGHATTAGFWKFFDRDRYVGGGSSSGGAEPEKPTLKENEMIRIQSPNRGIALIGPGFYRHLASSEEVQQSEPIIAKHLNGNDRQFDLWVSMASTGVAPSSLSPAQIKAIADATVKQIDVGDVAIDYDRIANTVREKFSSNPLK